MPLHSLAGTWQPSGNLLSPSLSLRWFQPFYPPSPSWHTVKFRSGVKMSGRYSEITGKFNISCWIWLRGCFNKARTHTKHFFIFFFPDRRTSRARGVCFLHPSAVDPHLLHQELKKINNKKKTLECFSANMTLYFFFCCCSLFSCTSWSWKASLITACGRIEDVWSNKYWNCAQHYGTQTGLQPHFTFLLDKQFSLHFSLLLCSKTIKAPYQRRRFIPLRQL